MGPGKGAGDAEGQRVGTGGEGRGEVGGPGPALTAARFGRPRPAQSRPRG